MISKLQAIVRCVTRQVVHGRGTLGSSGPETTGDFPAAVRIEIETSDGGVFLLRYDKDGKFCGDTWHQSIDEAKKQACFEFKVSADDWAAVTSP